MYCTQCGKQLLDTDRFCSQCGKPVGQPPGEPAPLDSRPKRRLCRIMSQKKVAGVCAGFAAYLEMDLTVVRIVFLALAILPPGIGAIAYVIGWIAMPRDDEVTVGSVPPGPPPAATPSR